MLCFDSMSVNQRLRIQELRRIDFLLAIARTILKFERQASEFDPEHDPFDPWSFGAESAMEALIDAKAWIVSGRSDWPELVESLTESAKRELVESFSALLHSAAD